MKQVGVAAALLVVGVLQANELHEAVKKGDIHRVQELAEKYPYMADQTDEVGCMPSDYLEDVEDASVRWNMRVALENIAGVIAIADDHNSSIGRIADEKIVARLRDYVSPRARSSSSSSLSSLDEGERMQREASRVLNEFYTGCPALCDSESEDGGMSGYDLSDVEVEWSSSESGGDYDLRVYYRSSGDDEY